MATVTGNAMSLEQFERIDTPDQIELLQGELIRMPPALRRHGVISNRLAFLLKVAVETLRKTPGEFLFGDVYVEMGYFFPGDPSSWLQPDVSISHREQPGERYYEGAPLMAFEIVSEHDSARELDRKVSMYLQHGAAEVWVIYPETRHAVVYHQSPKVVPLETKSVHSELLPGVEIPFADFL